MNRPTRVLKVDPHRPDPALLDEAAEVVRSGGLVAFPTETVYGLGADATNPDAVARVFEAKGRPATNPLIVHGCGIDAIRQAVSDWPPAAARLADSFWPGPLTLVLPRLDLISVAASAGLDTVGVRWPDCAVASEFLRYLDRPVAAPSANRSTGVSPTSAAHVLKDLDGRIDLILDGGPTPVGIESTVLDLTSDPPRILRPGAITAGQIGRVLGAVIETPGPILVEAGARPTSPGQMELHYSPRTGLRVVEPDELPDLTRGASSPMGLIVAGRNVSTPPGFFRRRVDWTDPTQAARELYATLHLWDEDMLPLILVVLPHEGDDEWRAVRDRLWRASRRWAREGSA